MLNPRSQILNSKQTQSPNLKNLKLFWICLGFSVLCLGFITINAYALDLEGLKINFLNGDYKAAITDGERIMANTRHDEPGMDELYYILGLSYLEDGNYLRASDIFEIILKEFKGSRFKEEAQLGLGDTYFLRGEIKKAEDCYKRITSENPRTKIKASVFYRLAQAGFKKGDTGQGKDYLDKLKAEFPLNLELRQNKDLSVLQSEPGEIYYTVQVGSFSNANNAKNIVRELTVKGYDAYIEESDAKMYRVKVGKFKTRQEAALMESRLSGEGYPTKISP